VEDLNLLRDGASGVQAALTALGFSRTGDADTLYSLGGVFDAPIFIFYRNAEPITQFAQFRGKRLSIGTPGTALRTLIFQVLTATRYRRAPRGFLGHSLCRDARGRADGVREEPGGGNERKSPAWRLSRRAGRAVNEKAPPTEEQATGLSNRGGEETTHSPRALRSQAPVFEFGREIGNDAMRQPRGALIGPIRSCSCFHPGVRSQRHQVMCLASGLGNASRCAWSRHASRSRCMAASISFNSVSRPSARAARWSANASAVASAGTYRCAASVGVQ
jgi:hypothetical protein